MIGNAPCFSVSDFVAVFNQSLSVIYPEVVIVGELSNFRISKNAWVYFDLKDEFSSIRFFGSVRNLPGPMEDGMMLEVVGSPNLHQQFGFSVNFYSMRAVGEGSINRALLLLDKKLELEGLFDLGRKRSLPFAPEKIAVISSKESAGYGDFIKIAGKRWPSLTHRLFDVLVQGSEAPKQIINVINQVNQMDFDALIIVRGGGSKDDLSAFDHEQLVRAVAASRIPTLIAIGHERDFSLAEKSADVRASTPSHAAEILLPDITEELKNLDLVKKQVKLILLKYHDELKQALENKKRLLENTLTQKLNEIFGYITNAQKLVLAYDPSFPLKKGYAIARTGDKVIRDSQQAKLAEDFNLQFIDGTIKVIYKEDKK